VIGAASFRALLLDALGSNPVTAAVAARLAMMTPTAAAATSGWSLRGLSILLTSTKGALSEYA
jgi:hypothetical protein